MIYYALNHYWKENKSEELASFLSDMNPFLFDDIGSAVPSVYAKYSLLVKEEISIDNSFSVACKYVKSLGLQSVTDAFACVGEDDWKARCVKYMSSTHKGQDI
ncbi:hypothetical protein HXT31_03850 [Gardnerella sp. DNF00622A]